MLERAEHRRRTSHEGTIFFLDEIHRFNKAQQDALLPAVEEGLVALVGATTENPYFEVNSALLSRCTVYEFRSLEDAHVLALLRRALTDERGVQDAPPVDDDALEFLAARAGETRGLPSPRSTLPARPPAAIRSRCATPRTRSSARRCSTTRAGTATTTRSRPGSRPPAAPIRMRRCSTWSRCWRAARTPASSPAAWSCSPARTWATPTRTRSRWRSQRPTRSSTWACRSARSTWRRRRSTSRWPRSRTPSSGRLAPPQRGSSSTGPRSRPAYLRSSARPGAGRGEGYDSPHSRSEGVSPQELMPAEAVGERFVELTDRGEEAALRERLEEIRRLRGR